jgi:hypothetical protein
MGQTEANYHPCLGAFLHLLPAITLALLFLSCPTLCDLDFVSFLFLLRLRSTAGFPGLDEKCDELELTNEIAILPIQ